MKNLFFVTILVLSAHCFAAGGGVEKNKTQWTGNFFNSHLVSLAGYDSQRNCESDGGRWTLEGYCLQETSDTVEIRQQGDIFTANISVTSIQGSSCGFEGYGKLNESQREIKLNMVKDLESDALVSSQCVVRIQFKGTNQIQVTANNKCQEYCGMSARLSISKAVRD